MSSLGPALTVPMALLGMLVLGFAIRYLVGKLKASRLLEAPLAAEVDLHFTDSGPVVLFLEGPTRYFGAMHRLDYELFDPGVGHEVPMRRTIPTKVSGFGRTRFAKRRFEVTHMGSHQLRVQKLPEDSDLSRWKLVLCRPLGLQLPLAILGIVAGALLLLFGILLTAFGLAGVTPS